MNTSKVNLDTVFETILVGKIRNLESASKRFCVAKFNYCRRKHGFPNIFRQLYVFWNARKSASLPYWEVCCVASLILMKQVSISSASNYNFKIFKSEKLHCFKTVDLQSFILECFLSFQNCSLECEGQIKQNAVGVVSIFLARPDPPWTFTILQ